MCREAGGTVASNDGRHGRGAGLARAATFGTTGLTWVPQLHVAHVGGQWPGLVSSGQVSTHSAPRKREPRLVSCTKKTAKNRKNILLNTGAEDSTRLLKSPKSGSRRNPRYPLQGSLGRGICFRRSNLSLDTRGEVAAAVSSLGDRHGSTGHPLNHPHSIVLTGRGTTLLIPEAMRSLCRADVTLRSTKVAPRPF